jgi:flavin-dependent dehydrogenase
MPDAVDALRELGVGLEECDAGKFTGVRFVEGESVAEACFPVGVGAGIRRIRLHEALHRRARELGVILRWGSQIVGPAEPLGKGLVTIQTGQEKIRTRWLIGADGMNSRIRKWSGLDAGRTTSKRIGLRQHYRIAPWSNFMEIHWAAPGQAYVTPAGAEEVGVVILSRSRYESVESALNDFPSLGSRLRGANFASSERGALTAGRAYKRVTNGGRGAAGCTALIGDASGSVDAIAGAGLGLAFMQAVALGDALRRGDLNLYERAHREIRRRPAFLSRSMLLMDRYAAIRSMSLASFRRNPWLLERILSIHAGALPLKIWGSNGIASLGMQLICG